MICILDYGSGNVKSVFNLLKTIAPHVRISNEVDVIRDASHLVLPGVGAFGAAMDKITQRIPLAAVADQVLDRRKPFLGICVGLHVLADAGFEFGEHRGLGWVQGRVDKLNAADLPLPHIGWNAVRERRSNPLLQHFQAETDFYFVHSYVFRPANADDVAATTTYAEEFCSVLHRDNVWGVQFHPEKSQKAGAQLIKNFLAQR